MNPYRYFSLMFSYPTEATLGQIRDMSNKNGDVAGLLSRDALQAIPLEEIQAEYTRMFISAYPQLLCPPYESYYREGLVYGNSSVAAHEWYRRHGLDFTFEGEPPDHVSIELEFLAITKDVAFLEKLREWIYEFTKRVKNHSVIYGRCAEDLEDFLKTA